MNLARRARASTGMTQRRLAAVLDIDHSQIARWERGKQRPSAAAAALLKVIEARPNIVIEVLQGVTSEPPEHEPSVPTWRRQ